MIKRAIVYVLGAGASQPYGFPTGSTLAQLVLQDIEKRHTPYYTMQDMGFGASHIDAFAMELRHSGKYSVDAFLEHRREFIDVGKAAMAIHLIGCENPDALWQSDNPRGDWYRYLTHQLTEMCSPDTFHQNEVAFITFNYDRSLETYLFSALKYSFGLTDEATRGLVDTIPILHLHGDLGPLPWQDGPYRPYNTDLSRDAINLARNRIHIVHDQTEERQRAFNSARSMIVKGDQIVFLGFGFGELNAGRLGLGQMKTPKGVATSLGMGEAEITRARTLVNWQVEFRSFNCLELLRQYPGLL